MNIACCILAVRCNLRFCAFTTFVIFNISSVIHICIFCHTHSVCILDPKNNLNRTTYCLKIFHHTTFQASCSFGDFSVIPTKEVFTATKDKVVPYVLRKCQILRVNRILMSLLSVATFYKMISVENSSVLFFVPVYM
jgi:hypothetical protein